MLLVPTVQAALRVADAGGVQASAGFSVAAETSGQLSQSDDQSGGVSASRAKASKWDWEALTDLGNLHGRIDWETKRNPTLSEETCTKLYAASKTKLAGLRRLKESG